MAQVLRERGHDPQAVAHFVNRLVFCMFADDVGLLPGDMFTRMLRHAVRAPEQFPELAGELFRVMASGGRIGYETVAWFNGGCSTTGRRCRWSGRTSRRCWRRRPSTGRRSTRRSWGRCSSAVSTREARAARAHYTDREKILQLVEPVVVRPLLAEWEREKAANRSRAGTRGSRPVARGADETGTTTPSVGTGRS